MASVTNEKAAVAYLNMVMYSKSKEDRTYSKFAKYWDKLFWTPESKDTRGLRLKAFKKVDSLLADKSIKEVRKYRNTTFIYKGTTVPKDIQKMADAKGLKVCLAKNRDKSLSGFDVLVRYSKHDLVRLNPIPYGFSEESTRNYVKSLSTPDELQAKEQNLKNMLLDDNVCILDKRKAVSTYYEYYATDEFRHFMNQYTMHECKDVNLTRDCVVLCKRAHIMNLKNKKPIQYEMCEGSGIKK